MDVTAIIPMAGVAALFVFGMRRQSLAHKVALEKVADKAETIVNEAGETVVVNKAADKENDLYSTKTRLSYGFVALSFGMGTVLLVLFAAILCYAAYVRATNNAEVNFLVMIWKGIAASARDNGITSYTATNVSWLSWILPFKPAALFTGAVEEGQYLGWCVMPNVAAVCAAAVAFLASTAKIIIDFVQKKTDKKALRMRRTYFVLLGGMVLAFGAGLWRGNVSALSGMLFHVLYLGFLPLIGMLLPEGEDSQEKVLINVALCTFIALLAVVFALTLPVMYGYLIEASRVRLFSWMSFLSKGFFTI
jgi:Ca2+/Na+ antiporter